MREIHHVGIVVRDMDAALEHYERFAGARVTLRKELPAFAVEAAAIELPDGGEIELLRPLDEEGSIGRFLAERGEGLHHVAYGVENVAGELARLTEMDVRLIDAEPRLGLHGVPVAFVHPRGMNGVLTELVEVGEHG